MKPIIGYAIAGRHWPWGKGCILAITSENKRQVFGRSQPDDLTTSYALRDIVARYKTYEEAVTIVKQMDAVREKFRPLIEEADAVSLRLQREQAAEMRKLAGSAER